MIEEGNMTPSSKSITEIQSPIATFRNLDCSYLAFRDAPKFRLSDLKDPAI